MLQYTVTNGGSYGLDCYSEGEVYTTKRQPWESKARIALYNSWRMPSTGLRSEDALTYAIGHCLEVWNLALIQHRSNGTTLIGEVCTVKARGRGKGKVCSIQRVDMANPVYTLRIEGLEMWIGQECADPRGLAILISARL